MLDSHELFSLASPEGLTPPLVSPAYDASSLTFLEDIHRRKSDSLKAFIQANGWRALVALDTHAEAAAFLIAQHADYDPEFQKHVHELMLENGSNPGFLAFLTDRILCNGGKHQRFGTQIREVTNGCFVPRPIEDSERVDELRQKAGLSETLSDYYIRVNNGDLLLYRPLMGGYAEELEDRKQHKVVEFVRGDEAKR